MFEVLAYDEEGNILRVVDGDGHETSSVYDELGRLRARTLAAGEPEETTTSFDYDLGGRLVSRTDGAGHSISIAYDSLGRVVTQADALGRTQTFSYDEVGNLVRSVNAAGERIDYAYDNRRLLVRRSGADLEDQFLYDSRGRLALALSPEYQQEFSYDPLDRVVAKSDNYSGTRRVAYDDDGLPTQLVHANRPVFGFPEGLIVHYQYNERGQLGSIVDPEAGTWLFEYDAIGRESRRIDPDGIERRVSYDSEYFVSAVEVYAGGSELAATQYSGYDARGNPQSIDGGVGLGVIGVQYDALSRVKQVTYPASLGTESFTYDLGGNRSTHQTRTGAQYTYVLDAADQLVEIQDDGTGLAVHQFGYDAAGRRSTHTPASGPATTYEYRCDGQLRRMVRDDGYMATLAYRPDGRPFRRRESGAEDAYYLSDGVEHRGGEAIRLVRAGPGGPVLAEIMDGTVRGLVRDGSANVSHVVSSGALESERRYESFGALISETAAAPVERGFAGAIVEGSSGLVRMGLRHYDPTVGRFVQSDALGVEADQLYAYAAYNPYRFRDPTGLAPVAIGDSAFGLPPVGGSSHLDRGYAGAGTQCRACPVGSYDVAGAVVGSYRSQPEWKGELPGYNALLDAISGSPPNDDGVLTLAEANYHYRHGNGARVTVDLGGVDFSNLSEDDFGGVGSSRYLSPAYPDRLVYGSIRLTMGPNGTVTSGFDVYDFNIQGFQGSWLSREGLALNARTLGRNVLTILGSAVAGSGTPYRINFTGASRLGSQP